MGPVPVAENLPNLLGFQEFIVYFAFYCPPLSYLVYLVDGGHFSPQYEASQRECAYAMGSAVMLCDDYAGMTVIIHSRNAAYLSDIELRRTSQASAASAACSWPPDGGCPKWRLPHTLHTNPWLTLAHPWLTPHVFQDLRGV